MNYATVQDVTLLFRQLTTEETTRVNELIPIVSAALRNEAKKVGKNFDAICQDDPDMLLAAKEVTVRVVGSVLSTDTTVDNNLTQFSQSGLGYVASGTYANPGGGIYFKAAELKRLGLKKQRIGVLEPYGN